MKDETNIDKLKIKLNKFPYMCPVIEDSEGVKEGYYFFTDKWKDHIIDLEIESETDVIWVGKVKTNIGWIKCELLKECFEKI